MKKIFVSSLLYLSLGFSCFPSDWLNKNVDCYERHEKQIMHIYELYDFILSQFYITEPEFYETCSFSDETIPQKILGRDFFYANWGADQSYSGFYREYKPNLLYRLPYLSQEFSNDNIDIALKIIDCIKEDYNQLLNQYLLLGKIDYQNLLNRKGPHPDKVVVGGIFEGYESSCRNRIDSLIQKLNPDSKFQQSFSQLKEALLELLNSCSNQCFDTYALWNKGLYFFREGDFMSCLDMYKVMLENCNLDEMTYGDEPSFVYQGKGEISRELALYSEAVEALDKAIAHDPTNKEAYFERAVCYFEKGDFKKSIQDFLSTEIKITKIDSSDFKSLDFAAGLIKATTGNVIDSVMDFIPSIFSTVSGLSQGLWAFVSHPVDCSIEMIEACNEMAELICDHSAYENMKLLIPEIGDLAENWQGSTSFKKGQLLGVIIGKYGTDVFIISRCSKAIKAYRNLRKANNLMTLDGLAKGLKKDKLMELSKLWQTQSKKTIEVINKEFTGRELYKELRHIVDENQLRIALHKHGVVTFKRPKGIPAEWVVRVSDKGRGMKYYNPNNPSVSVRVMPGNPLSPNPAQKKPYVVQRVGKNAIDKNGNIVVSDSIEAHIPYNEYFFRNN